ncbi:MAG: cytochrome c biogenesis protein CcdA [Candidatus Sumerlaeia bacterium]|nr:cytochrome c biogenesis protein CcdA [Candidatus Sumerlaeia bacterium]
MTTFQQHPATPNPATGVLRALLLALVALALLLPAGAPAQAARPKHPVTAEAKLSAETAGRGDTVTLTVTAVVDPAYHLYAMKLSGEGPVATEVVERSVPEWFAPAGDWKEPTPKVSFDEGFQTNIEKLYGSPVVFTREYRIGTAAPDGAHTLELAFLHQACTEVNCLAPKRLPMTVSFAVSGGAEPGSELPEITSTEAPAAGGATSEDAAAPAIVVSSPADRLESAGFSLFLLLAFAGGIVSLATPCVFPMIPITISYFTKRAAKTRKETIKLAFVYGGTIIGAFSLFGFALAVVLRLLGAGDQASGFITKIAADPAVNLALAAVFIAFALSLFGMFEIGLPAGIGNKLQQLKGTRSDYVGAMLMAAIFVVVSFTCTAPIVGFLIVGAVQGEWFRPFFGLMAYSAGFALPFFVLALVPQALASLPKAGGWLNSTKVVMGLLELAAAFKFISNADQIWRWGIFNREVVLSAWVAISAAIALYLLNKIRTPHDTDEPTVGPVRLILAVSFATLALVMSVGLYGGRLPSFIASYLPVDIEAESSAAGGGSRVASLESELSFHKTWEAGLAEAQATGKPLFLDFTGYTCTNCRLMERNVFPKPEVEALLSDFVRVKLYTDDAVVGEAHQEFQIERFGTVALPTYVVLTPQGETVAIEGYQPNSAKFAEFLRKGL